MTTYCTFVLMFIVVASLFCPFKVSMSWSNVLDQPSTSHLLILTSLLPVCFPCCTPACYKQPKSDHVRSNLKAVLKSKKQHLDKKGKPGINLFFVDLIKNKTSRFFLFLVKVASKEFTQGLKALLSTLFYFGSYFLTLYCIFPFMEGDWHTGPCGHRPLWCCGRVSSWATRCCCWSMACFVYYRYCGPHCCSLRRAGTSGPAVFLQQLHRLCVSR